MVSAHIQMDAVVCVYPVVPSTNGIPSGCRDEEYTVNEPRFLQHLHLGFAIVGDGVVFRAENECPDMVGTSFEEWLVVNGGSCVNHGDLHYDRANPVMEQHADHVL